MKRVCCQEARKPLLIVDRAKTSEATDAAAAILDFVKANEISVLNVAGPRTSNWSEGFAFAFAVISRVLGRKV